MPAPAFIDTETIKSLLDPKDLLSVIENAMAQFSLGEKGGVVQPVRTRVTLDSSRFMLAMPGYSNADSALATKMVTVYPNNPEKGLPTITAHIFVHDPENGQLVAIMEGDYVTELRTAIASAVATKYLANPKSKILAIIGTGAQARSHYTAMCLLYQFDEIRIWGRTESKAKLMAQELNDARIKVCSSGKEACADADVICVCVMSATPVIQKEWVKAGAHVNSIGANAPNLQECDPELLRSAKVYGDSMEALKVETGDIIIPKIDVYGEIGEIINGTKKAFPEETTVFKSMGMAIEDVVTANLVYDKYKAQQK